MFDELKFIIKKVNVAEKASENYHILNIEHNKTTLSLQFYLSLKLVFVVVCFVNCKFLLITL